MNAGAASISNINDNGLDYGEMNYTNVSDDDIGEDAIRYKEVIYTCRGTKFRSSQYRNVQKDRLLI